MRRILLSTLMIGLVVAVAVGATRAWFTASYTEPGNTFATGQLSFDLRADAQTDSWPFSFTGMLPGESNADEDIFNVYNHANSATMKYRLYTKRTSGPASVYNKIRYDAYRCNWYSGTPVDCGSWSQIVDNGWLKDINGTTGWIVSPVNIPKNNSHWWKFSLWLDESAGNSAQGQTVVFDIIGNGTQPENPGWSE